MFVKRTTNTDYFDAIIYVIHVHRSITQSVYAVIYVTHVHRGAHLRTARRIQVTLIVYTHTLYIDHYSRIWVAAQFQCKSRGRQRLRSCLDSFPSLLLLWSSLLIADHLPLLLGFVSLLLLLPQTVYAELQMLQNKMKEKKQHLIVFAEQNRYVVPLCMVI